MLNAIRFAVLAAFAVAASPSSAGDLLIHDGFETCWASAKTRPQFLESMRTSIEGTTACIPPRSGEQSGVGYTICQTVNGCGTAVNGCAVTMHAGAFSGNFVNGEFSGPGSANNIAIPVTTTAFGNCTINLTAITLGYLLDYLMQADGVDGVYTADPRRDPSAELLHSVTYQDALQRGLKVVDSTAFSLCMDNGMDMRVFGMSPEGNIARAILGEDIGTLVTSSLD